MPDNELLIETPWETRNLGRRSFELSAAALADSAYAAVGDAIADAVRTSGPIFVHARVSRDQLDRIPRMQGLGFYVVECSVEPFLPLGKNAALSRFTETPAAFVPQRFRAAQLSLATLARGDHRQEENIRATAAESFVDDRFHLDFQCPPGLASRRYAHWVNDLLADARVTFHLFGLNGATIGFFASRNDHLILSGFTRSHSRSGLGEYFWLSVCNVVQSAGFAAARSRISCNNLASLNLCARIGFKFRATAYSLHCWRDSTSSYREHQ